MAATCDISFDELAVALSYISLGGAVTVSTDRGLPAAPAVPPPAAATKKEEEPAKVDKDDDDVSSRVLLLRLALVFAGVRSA